MDMFLSFTALLVLLFSTEQGVASERSPRSNTPSFIQISLTVPVHITVNATAIDLEPPKNQTQLTGLVQEILGVNSPASSLQVGSTPLTRSYNIAGDLFVPNDWETRGSGVLELAVHGSTLDRFYWLIGGAGSEFNYVESAIASGNAIFIFDRLGCGQSTKPDGIKEVQVPVHVAVIEALQSGIHTEDLVANRGDVVDGLILTGFSADITAVALANAGLDFMIASQADPSKFGTLNNAYVTPSSRIGVQQGFFFFPEFPQSTLDFVIQNTGLATLGEMLTRSQSISKPAIGFTTPVLVVTGRNDATECGGDCERPFNGTSDNLLEATQSLFPLASAFETFMPNLTGH
ncbi:hypothetical protein EIP91_010502, partial [Steccherinum ochraceum]